MIQNLRILRSRIRSVQNTRKITRAMQMVAGAKLRRLQGDLMNFRPYAKQLRTITERFLANHPDIEHPLLSTAHPELVEGERLTVRPSTGLSRGDSRGSGRTELPPVGLILVTSDTGLCGTYNERVIAAAQPFLLEHPSAVVVTIGKKGNRIMARRGIARLKEILDWGGRYDSTKVSATTQWLKDLYLNGGVSAWWIATTQFISALRFKPVVERFLPLDRLAGAPRRLVSLPIATAGADPPERVITEPNPGAVAQELLARFVSAQFTRVLLEAFTSEHSARMIAMKNATDNAAEMIEHLTLVRNKVRQAAITKELIEVVSGSEALK